MAVTTNYSFRVLSHFAIPGNVDTHVASNGTGAYAISAQQSPFNATNVYSFDANGNLIGQWVQAGAGGGTDVVMLANGNIVVATYLNNSISYEIRTPTGVVVKPLTGIGDDGSSRPYLLALDGGGFVMVSNDLFSVTDLDVDMRIFDAAGNLVNTIGVDLSTAYERNAAVTQLSNGDLAVVWQRESGGTYGIYYKIYTPAGAVVKGETLLENIGTNQAPDIQATPDGGFVITYSDSSWNLGGFDITLAKLDSAGNFQYFRNVSNPSLVNGTSSEYETSLATLENGLIVITFERNNGAESDQQVILFDSTTGEIVSFEHSVTGGLGQINNAFDPDIAATAGDRLVAVHSSNVGGLVIERLGVVRNWVGDGANDLVTGDHWSDLMIGNAGNDTLRGDAGDDFLFGGFGEDSLEGGDGRDLLRSGPQNDTLIGGEGADTLGGSLRHDLLRGGGDGDLLIGSNGNDRLFGEAGDDTLVGGNGRDILIGGGGADRMNGGSGKADLADYSGAGASIWVRLSTGDGLAGEAIGDSLVEIENLTGSAFSDTLEGSNARNVLRGSSGADVISALSGNDVLSGDAGNDTLTGGDGADQFWFRPGEGADRVNDFVAGAAAGDVIRLFGFGPAFDTFAEVRAAAVQVGADTFIDFGSSSITLVGVSKAALTAGDFVFG